MKYKVSDSCHYDIWELSETYWHFKSLWEQLWHFFCALFFNGLTIYWHLTVIVEKKMAHWTKSQYLLWWCTAVNVTPAYRHSLTNDTCFCCFLSVIYLVAQLLLIYWHLTVIGDKKMTHKQSVNTFSDKNWHIDIKVRYLSNGSMSLSLIATYWHLLLLCFVSYLLIELS